METARSKGGPGTALSLNLNQVILRVYVINTSNLGLDITVLGREREQGRFRGKIEGVRESSEGAGGSTREHRGSRREH